MTAIVSIFTIIAALATVTYTIITFRTLKEIKAQRETTYRPDVIVDESFFYIYSSETGEMSFPTEYTYEKKEAGYKPKQHYSNSFGLKFYNIGLAAAKNIQINFSIDINKIVDLVINSSKDVDEDKRINVKHSNNSVEFKPEKKDISYASFHVINNQLERSLNHLLPVNVEANPFIIALPTYILELNALMIYNIWNTKNKNKGFNTIPTMTLAIQYCDIGNKIHKKTVEVSIEYFGGSREESRGIIRTVEKNYA